MSFLESRGIGKGTPTRGIALAAALSYTYRSVRGAVSKGASLHAEALVPKAPSFPEIGWCGTPHCSVPPQCVELGDVRLYSSGEGALARNLNATVVIGRGNR